jgi:hypothetical protein
MTFIFLPDAYEEMVQAGIHYELEQDGLGWRFRKEVDDVIVSIVRNPFLWRERRDGCRRVNLPIFPYYIAYTVRGETVVVIAVAHAQRRPDIGWID